MLNFKGVYEWKLINAETGAVEQEGTQNNVISDRILNFMFTATSSGAYSAYYSSIAIQLSDVTPSLSVDYRVAGASNGFTFGGGAPITAPSQLYRVDWNLLSKNTEYNFPPPGTPRTITVIGIAVSSSFATPNFVSFITLSTPITQSTSQYLYVRYTIFVSYAGGGNLTANNKYIDFTMKNSLFSVISLFFGGSTSDSYYSSCYVTPFIPPNNINNLGRSCVYSYRSIRSEIVANTGSPFALTYQRTFGTTEVVGPIGTVCSMVNYSATDGDYPPSTNNLYHYSQTLFGYSRDRSMVPSVSRVFAHPGSRDNQIFSDPSSPPTSRGAVAITGTPTNKYPMIGRIRITKSGDASDLVDETVNFSAVDSGADTITVTQDIATEDIYRLTTTGTLPAPLALLTDYYVIRVNATTIRLATSAVNAQGGIYIDLTTSGTGDHTLARQNTGRYRLELEPWIYNGNMLQLPMAVDVDNYTMPLDLMSQTNQPNSYAEGDYICNSTSTYGNELLYGFTASMLRGSLKNGDYVYSVQQSRKGLINNICRWYFNSIESSVALCKFGTGSTKVTSVFANVANTKMYITTNEGLYEYTFSTPTVAPVLLTITGIINNNITDACLDPVTGYIWAGHTTGLSRIDTTTNTAVQYTTAGSLSGLSAGEVNIVGGQLDAYNGRVLRAGVPNVVSYTGDQSYAWVLQDGVGYYRPTGTQALYSGCIRRGTNHIIFYINGNLLLYNVVVTGPNAGTVTNVESWGLLGSIYGWGMSIGEVSKDTYMYLWYDGNSSTYKLATYRIGSAPVLIAYSSNITSYTNGLNYGNSYGWALAPARRNLIDLDGNGNYALFWHMALIMPQFPNPNRYGWNGSTWVKDLVADRAIPKTATHTLLNGLSVDFNNATGSVPYDQQFYLNDSFNFVHAPYRIKDNLQEVQIKARSYYCKAIAVENYAHTLPGSGNFALNIPEKVDPDFRDLDTVDFVTEIYEGVNRYIRWTVGSPLTYTVAIGTDILTVSSNIPTGTPIIPSTTGTYPAPIVINVTYYAINLSPTTISLATTYANALLGTAIDITSAGTGTQTLYRIEPTTGTYYSIPTGTIVFSAADAGKNLTLTYTYTKF